MKDGPEVAEGVKTASSATNGRSDNSPVMRSLNQRPTEVSLPVGGTLLGAPIDPEKPPTTNGTSTKMFSCSICNRCFGYKHVLQNHERTHTGEKPFECPECHKRFTRDHHLKTHMRLHTGEKPYQCSHCDRHFVQVANLRRHLRVHTGERPYACQTCESRFSDSNQLKAHMLIHRGEKPFQCPECLGRFRRRHHLIHHKCPKDLANLGKPRRGRRAKAFENGDHNHNNHHHHTILPSSNDDDERISDEEEDEEEEEGIVDDDNCSDPPDILPDRRKPSRTIRILTPQQRELFLRDKVTMQTQAIDMSLTPDSNGTPPPVTVIVPNRFLSVEGVLDLSSSRSDSEIDHIEEEEDVDVDVEETIDVDNGYDDFPTNFRHTRFSQRIANHHPHNNNINKVEQTNGVNGHPPETVTVTVTNGIHLNGDSNHVRVDDGQGEDPVTAPLPLTKRYTTAAANSLRFGVKTQV